MSNSDSREIGLFYGKPVGTNMTKTELLDVIAHLASENTELRKESYEYKDVIYAEQIRRLPVYSLPKSTNDKEDTR